MGKVWDSNALRSASNAELRSLSVRAATQPRTVDPTVTSELSQEIRRRGNKSEAPRTNARRRGRR